MVLSMFRRPDRKRAIWYRVFVNGREVTNDCFYVDGRRRVARCYVRVDGLVQLNASRTAPLTVEYRGDITLRRKVAA